MPLESAEPLPPEIVQVGDQYWAFGLDGASPLERPRLMHSDDGIRWRVVALSTAAHDIELGEFDRRFALAADGDAVILVGSAVVTGPGPAGLVPGAVGVVWWSEDAGSTWAFTTEDELSQFQSVLALGDGTFAIGGSTGDSEQSLVSPVVWTFSPAGSLQADVVAPGLAPGNLVSVGRLQVTEGRLRVLGTYGPHADGIESARLWERDGGGWNTVAQGRAAVCSSPIANLGDVELTVGCFGAGMLAWSVGGSAPTSVTWDVGLDNVETAGTPVRVGPYLVVLAAGDARPTGFGIVVAASLDGQRFWKVAVPEEVALWMLLAGPGGSTLEILSFPTFLSGDEPRTALVLDVSVDGLPRADT